MFEIVKKDSSKWFKTKGLYYKKFYWQAGYAVFSVSQSKVEVVKQYIRNQKEHHKKKSFQDEFRKFLQEYKIDYDEHYVWD